MLMEVRNQLKVTLLSIKYGIMREMLNKASFITNILFMVLNNAGFIVEWIILYSVRENIGGYTFKQVLLLWGIAAGSYGFSHAFCKNAYNLSGTITNGKMDAYLVQPKSVLIQSITSDISPSAFGDVLFAYLMLFIYGFTPTRFIVYTLINIMSSLILTAFAIIFGSLSFWFNNASMIADTGNSLMTTFATYPEGIFKGLAKMLLYTIIPIGITTYVPVQIMTSFDLKYFLLVLVVTLLILGLANIIFYKGLKRYSSTNLMIARI